LILLDSNISPVRLLYAFSAVHRIGIVVNGIHSDNAGIVHYYEIHDVAHALVSPLLFSERGRG